MLNKIKYLILLIVFLTATAFFFKVINDYLRRSKAAIEGAVNIGFTPVAGNFPVGEVQKLVILFTPSNTGNKISGIDLRLKAEGNLKFVDIQNARPFITISTSEGSSFNNFIQVKKLVADQSVRIVSSAYGPDNQLPVIVQVDVTFTGTGVGAGKIVVDTINSQVVGNQSSTMAYNIAGILEGSYSFGSSCIPRPACLDTIPACDIAEPIEGWCTKPPNPTCVPRPACLDLIPHPCKMPELPEYCPAGSVLLDLKLKLQGITSGVNSSYNNQKVKIYLSKDSQKSQIQTGDYVSDESGVWHDGIIPFPDMTAGASSILVKGPKHLQKKLNCLPGIDTAAKRLCSASGIDLVAGVNNLDFSSEIIFAGDLPEQDGIIDSYDISLIRNNLGNHDQGILEKADLNLDGVVDAQDYSLVMTAMQNQTEDEQ